MNHHPDIYPYLHAARAADLQAHARAWGRTVGAGHAGRGSTPVRARLGWLLVETGLRLLHSRTPSRPAEG